MKDNRCSCESSHCEHCKEWHKGVPGACTNTAEYKVEMFGIKTRLCTPCLESAKESVKAPQRITWYQLGELPVEIEDEPSARIPSQIDLKPTHGVSIELSAEGDVLWVNVDGICRLRASRSPRIEVRVAGQRPIIFDTTKGAKADAILEV